MSVYHHNQDGLVTVDGETFVPAILPAAAPRIPGVISLDVRPFMTAMRRTMRAVSKLLSNPTIMRLVRQQADRDAIRKIADKERTIALDHLDAIVAAAYADLGLERHP